MISETPALSNHDTNSNEHTVIKKENIRNEMYTMRSFRNENISNTMVDETIPNMGCKKYPYTEASRQIGKPVIRAVQLTKKIRREVKK